MVALDTEPKVSYAWTVYRVGVPRVKDEVPIHVYVEVDRYGMINIDPRSIWVNGKIGMNDYSKSHYQLMLEIMDWLVEWELIEWRQIGPEDRELFATKKLAGEDYE